MVISVAELRLGDTVFDRDGQKIGIINQVMQAPQGADGHPCTMYIEVEHGGIAGIGAKSLYIPDGEIDHVDGHRGIHLECTLAEAEKRFATKPSL
jgi:hypothetical protein